MPARPLADARSLWPMNSLGNPIFDLSGNGKKGTMVNDVTWGAGKFGPALNFGGFVDYVNFGYWNNPSGKASFVAHVRFDRAIGSNEQIASADKTNTPNSRSLQFRRSAAGKLQLITWTGNVAKIITGTTTLTTGLCWWVAGVCDGVKSYLYVNGISDATPVASGSMDNDTNVHFLLGGRDTNGDLLTINDGLLGRMDCFLRFDHTVSASEIAYNREPFCMFPEPIMPEFGIAV